MDEDPNKKLGELKKRLKSKHEAMSVPMNQIDLTRENYDKLFPDSKVSTPIGEVKLGGHQFDKLNVKSLQKYLGGMHQTLSDPITVIKQNDNRGKTHLFTKSFSNMPKRKDGMISVVPNIAGLNVSISTHPRKLGTIIDNIKKAADVVYEKPISGRTAGNGTEALASIDTDDTRLPSNIPQSLSAVNPILLPKNAESTQPYSFGIGNQKTVQNKLLELHRKEK